MEGLLQSRDMEEQGSSLAQHGPEKAGVLTSAGFAW